MLPFCFQILSKFVWNSHKYWLCQIVWCSGVHHIILKGQNPVSSLSSHPTAKPSGTAAQFHSTFRSANPDNPTSIASHITVSPYTATLSQCHFRSIIQSIPHTLQHQEISTFRSVTHALVVSRQTHAADLCSFNILCFLIIFQLTASRRGWRIFALFEDHCMCISTHSLTKRLTVSAMPYAAFATFQLTASRRGWLFFIFIPPP